jgi:hypothetical protein
MTELLPIFQQELKTLDERKWDLLDELQSIELAKAALLRKIREEQHGGTIPQQRTKTEPTR